MPVGTELNVRTDGRTNATPPLYTCPTCCILSESSFFLFRIPLIFPGLVTLLVAFPIHAF